MAREAIWTLMKHLEIVFPVTAECLKPTFFDLHEKFCVHVGLGGTGPVFTFLKELGHDF